MIIDISKFQTVTDWSKVKEAVDGVIIRMGYRGYNQGNIVLDSKYKEFRKACEEYSIPHSFYFFPCSISDKEAKEEADFIIEELKGTSLDFPVFLDSEVAEASGNGRADKLSKAKRTRFLKIIMDKLKESGIECGVYASTSWYKDKLNDSELSEYVHWVAQYSSKLTYKGDYLFWQYTSKGLVPGINGNVDISRKNTNIIENKSEDSETNDVNESEDYNMPTIRKGSKGKAVKIWQIILGFAGENVDGIFGDNTLASTKVWQKNHNLSDDGIVGPNTWKAGLNSV